MEQEAKMPVNRKKRDINERSMLIICYDSLYMSDMLKRELQSKLYDRKDKLYSKFACHYAINAYTQCDREVQATEHKIKSS